jgi:hypothetical protein
MSRAAANRSAPEASVTTTLEHRFRNGNTSSISLGRVDGDYIAPAANHVTVAGAGLIEYPAIRMHLLPPSRSLLY